MIVAEQHRVDTTNVVDGDRGTHGLAKRVRRRWIGLASRIERRVGEQTERSPLHERRWAANVRDGNRARRHRD